MAGYPHKEKPIILILGTRENALKIKPLLEVKNAQSLWQFSYL